ncbi:hypothetical protein N136_01740 [Leifsonia aquatica ATCC 14665]|uniref:Uncharacterized protein n=1 Tax=Leifsonia aquatica ATCC 14665 TaxID=1358026 RepID=U2RTM6_LEIAQ|nr:hypothetical protein N136_01740 [Leifsonia aquatica ATCC 14665]
MQCSSCAKCARHRHARVPGPRSIRMTLGSARRQCKMRPGNVTQW